MTVRGTVLLLTLLLAVTEQFHLDAVLGAFLAGMVLRRWAGAGLPSLEGKLDALGYGFFIPIFFVYSGMSLDLQEVISAPLRVFLFAGLMLLVHVVPVFALYRRELVLRKRWQMAFVVSTALPLVVSAGVGSVLGFAASAGVARSADQAWHPPGLGYLLAALAALAVAGLVTCLTLPLIAATTRPEAVRFD